MIVIRRALLSVSNKAQLLELATLLSQYQIELISTGGTFRALQDAKIPVTEVAEVTQFPEMMDGRVKTLHPAIQGGILARRGQDDAVLAQHQIQPIDLVVVNLYPFADTVRKPGATFADAIENIDVGGPTMLRAAAKNCAFVTVLTDPSDYAEFMQQLSQQGGAVSAAQRQAYAAKAFAHTAAYDAMISHYFQTHLTQLTADTRSANSSTEPTDIFPLYWTPSWKRQTQLRYGENPHQQAAVYVPALSTTPSIANSTPLQGKALSFNNLADANAALACVRELTEPACVIVKHANPCGAAIADSILNAYQYAYQTDPTSAFGGIIAFNRPVDAQTAQTIVQQQFVEVLLAPAFDAAALAVLASKPNLRVLACNMNAHLSSDLQTFAVQSIDGGILVQTQDQLTKPNLQIVTQATPTDLQWQDLQFAWKIVQQVKSNAIVYAKQGRTYGIGAGQMSRSFSVEIAALKAQAAGLDLHGSVLASDAFFPFADGVEAAAAQGVTAIIQPGGSIKDPEVIAAANAANIAMVFTGIRHFKH